MLQGIVERREAEVQLDIIPGNRHRARQQNSFLLCSIHPTLSNHHIHCLGQGTQTVQHYLQRLVLHLYAGGKPSARKDLGCRCAVFLDRYMIVYFLPREIQQGWSMLHNITHGCAAYCTALNYSKAGGDTVKPHKRRALCCDCLWGGWSEGFTVFAE